MIHKEEGSNFSSRENLLKLLMDKITILAIDDDEISLQILAKDITKWGYSLLTAKSAEEALEMLANNHVDLVISDHRMPGMDGLELLSALKAQNVNIPFIMLTAFATIDRAVLSLKQGADDYLQKPYEPKELQATIRRSFDYKKLFDENLNLKDQLFSPFRFNSVVSCSHKIQSLLLLSEKVAASPDTTVAIYGESGTGKEVLARAIHVASERGPYKFVAINCAGIPATLLESELFGYIKGAFTGADNDRDGKFDLAQKGTILLDEIGDMPLDLQAKLLRVIEGRTYEKVGATKSIPVDFRIIVATHRNLEERVRNGTFREDLYHRINSFPIKLPPLRERKEDVPLLAKHFLNEFKNKLGKNINGISDEAMKVLENYSWPGNIRELKNCIERATILLDEGFIQPNHLIISSIESARSKDLFTQNGYIYLNIGIPADEFSLARINAQVIQIALDKFDNNKSKAAEYLKINRSAFYR